MFPGRFPVFRPVSALRLPATIALAAALAACGGAVTDLGNVVGLDQGETPRGNGIFRDSNVSGLDYESGELSGVTSVVAGQTPGGQFQFEIGRPVTFSIGGVTLGSASLGSSFLTPIDLVGNGNTGRADVQNIARFLMMLDNNGNPDDGIAISEAVRAVAQNWQPLNFGSPTFDADLIPIISDVASVDDRVPALPGALTAKNHLDATLRCSYSGAFGGTFADSTAAIGNFAFSVDSRNGILSGFVRRTNVEVPAVDPLNGITALRFDGQNISAVSVSGRTQSSGDVFTFQFTTINQIDGNWQNSNTSTQGTFTGARVNDTQLPLYRFTGRFDGDDSGVFSFGVADAGFTNISGEMYTAVGVRTTISARVNGLTAVRSLIMNGGDVKAFTGEINLDTMTISGTWEQPIDRETTNIGTFSGTGCRLN
jgi:hypothetical protein